MTDLERRLRDALSREGGASSDFDLNADVALPPNRTLTKAAVLVGIRPNGNIVLTKRSARLKHHPGQIAFPGGKHDKTDTNLIETALREAHEEIGLPKASTEVLGQLPAHETVTGFTVTPVIALLHKPFTVAPEAGEVSEVFDVPLNHCLRFENYRAESRRWQGRRRFYYAVPYGPYYIWGATARILRGLADRMQE